MSRFRDAHPMFRCRATIRLKDGTRAQCGRRYNDGTRTRADGGAMLCLQHFRMYLRDAAAFRAVPGLRG